MKARFEWDPAKASCNLRKHGVSFPTAARVFADPLRATGPDQIVDGELRWRTIGLVEGFAFWLWCIHFAKQRTARKSFELSLRAARNAEKGGAMRKKLVKYELNLENLPPLTARQRAEIEKLKAGSGKEIDFSDIPRTSEQFWKVAVRGGLYRPVKASTTVRVDADVLHWLKSKGKGYQTRINAILRQAMLDEAGKRARSA